MPSRQQHKSRYESIFRPSPCSPPNLPSYYDFGFDQPILYQPRSPVYTPQPFGHILGSYTPRPKQPRWQAPSTMTRHKATRSMAPTSFRTRSPPSPVASTFTASSSTPSSASSQSATNGAFGPSYLPLSSWTKGSNVWRSRLIGTYAFNYVFQHCASCPFNPVLSMYDLPHALSDLSQRRLRDCDCQATTSSTPRLISH